MPREDTAIQLPPKDLLANSRSSGYGYIMTAVEYYLSIVKNKFSVSGLETWNLHFKHPSDFDVHLSLEANDLLGSEQTQEPGGGSTVSTHATGGVGSSNLLRCSILIWSMGIMRLPLLSRFSHVRLCDPVGHSPPGSFIQGILQARILKWVAISYSIWG